jgi:hypothetical protein
VTDEGVDTMKYLVKLTRVLEESTLVEIEAGDPQEAQVEAIKSLGSEYPDRNWRFAGQRTRVNYVKDADGVRVVP